MQARQQGRYEKQKRRLGLIGLWHVGLGGLKDEVKALP